MADDLKAMLREMADDHLAHLERLLTWKASGGRLVDYPGNETLDQFIQRERRAIINLETVIKKM